MLVLGVALLFSACAVVPESGRTQLMLISPGQELSMGRQAHDLMQAAGHQTRWHEYAMAHEVCMPEKRDRMVAEMQ